MVTKMRPNIEYADGISRNTIAADPRSAMLLRNPTAATLLAGLTSLAAGLAPASAANVTACTALNICYCVNADLVPVIDANVAHIRALIAEQRRQGKAIGYMSIAISTAGGGYFGVNGEIATQTKARIEKRFGAGSVWVLNPGGEGSLPANATGADYMLMWTRVLEGVAGLGEDFDFFYFVGPSDAGRLFDLTGVGDMEKIDAYFDARLARDPALQKAVADGKVSKATFRNYYGLRAAVTFSYGSHDEWNIARLLNERRRGADRYGLAGQLGLFFDGQPVLPGGYETSVAPGDAGRCVN
jgi:hypothetical protein